MNKGDYGRSDVDLPGRTSPQEASKLNLIRSWSAHNVAWRPNPDPFPFDRFGALKGKEKIPEFDSPAFPMWNGGGLSISNESFEFLELCLLRGGDGLVSLLSKSVLK